MNLTELIAARKRIRSRLQWAEDVIERADALGRERARDFPPMEPTEFDPALQMGVADGITVSSLWLAKVLGTEYRHGLNDATDLLDPLIDWWKVVENRDKIAKMDPDVFEIIETLMERI